MVDQAHPHYHEGFFDALQGDPIFDDATPEYRAGWEAAWRTKEMFRDAGFTQDGVMFSVGFSLSKTDGKDAT